MKKNNSIEYKKLEYLYENSFMATMGYAVVVSFMFFVFYTHSDMTSLKLWYGVSIFIAILRNITSYYYKQHPHNIEALRNFYKLYKLYILISGALLGACSIFVIPDGIEYPMIFLLFAGGLCVGASVSLATDIKLFYSYLVLSLFPLFIHLFNSTHELSLIMSFVLIFFIFISVFTTKNNAKIVKHNFDISFENSTLVKTLENNIQELNESSQAKSKFLSMMSHEIRTPLNAIIGFIKILKDKEKDPTKLKYIETVDKSSFLLLNVIDDILDINKIEAGKLDLELYAFNPNEEFEHLFLLFSQIAKDKDINFINNIQKDLPAYLFGDIHRLKQISSNLLSNAVKFTPENKNIYFNISYHKDSSLLVMEVKDEGIGIKEENISKLTQEYIQASQSTSREYGGTGLGLSIVKQLLALMDTSLEIQSEFGKGSTFTCKIPLKSVESTPKETKETSTFSFKGKRVLVAEDNKTNQMLIELILQEYNLSVTLSDDGVQAEEAFKKEEFDLVLMDINMPHQNGVDTMKAIKRYETKTTTPIVALTANAVSGDRQRYLEEGFDGYLTKPIDNKKLQDLLIKYLA